jgi:3-oxoacyl-(acyl-carrier-protein) synthase
VARHVRERIALHFETETPRSNVWRRARIAPDEVGSIPPHATSTPRGDIAEYPAMVQVIGPALRKMPISATPSMIGHLLGAAEAVAFERGAS